MAANRSDGDEWCPRHVRPALGQIMRWAGTLMHRCFAQASLVCKISGVRSGIEFGMGQGGRGEDIHARAAVIPSPVLG